MKYKWRKDRVGLAVRVGDKTKKGPTRAIRRIPAEAWRYGPLCVHPYADLGDLIKKTIKYRKDAPEYVISHMASGYYILKFRSEALAKKTAEALVMNAGKVFKFTKVSEFTKRRMQAVVVAWARAVGHGLECPDTDVKALLLKVLENYGEGVEVPDKK